MSAETSLIKVNHKALTNQNNHQTSHVTNNYLNQQSWYLKGLSQCANQKTMCLEDNIYVSTIFICVRKEYPDSIYFVVHVYDFSYLPFDIHVKKYRKNNSHEFGLFT